MQKWLLALCLCFSFSVVAEEVDLLAPAPETEKVIIEPQSLDLPTCNNEKLIKKVHDFIVDYNAEHPAKSLIAQRRQTLQLRFLSKFSEEQVSGFTAQNNRIVADKLLMSKVNNSLDDSQIRLCKSDVGNTNFKPVYLMLYADKHNQIQVYILNFIENSNDEISFVL